MNKIAEKKKALLISLEKNLGIVTPTCREIGISRNQFYKYYREDPDFRQSVDEINEVALDFVELQLMKNIKAGSEKSILFYMKYKAKKRGYTEDININGNIQTDLSGALNIKVIFDDGSNSSSDEAL